MSPPPAHPPAGASETKPPSPPPATAPSHPGPGQDRPPLTGGPDACDGKARLVGGPNHRDLYLLIVGLLAGVLLGPGVLGQVSPWLYDKAFRGSGPAQKQLEQYDQTNQDALAKLKESGASPEAVQEKEDLLTAGRAPLQAQVLLSQSKHRDWMLGRMNALLLAILTLMVIETMLPGTAGAGSARWRGRLATARYALLAIWLLLLLAEPSSLYTTSVLFVALLVIASLVFAIVPLGWIKAKASAA